MFGFGYIPPVEEKKTETLPVLTGGVFDQVCPACKVRGCYIGLHEVECQNNHCKHWSERWQKDYQKLVQEELEKRKTQPPPQAGTATSAARSYLTEEFGLDWGENEITTQEVDAILGMTNGILP